MIMSSTNIFSNIIITDEVNDILNNIKNNQNTVIEAYAGAGKTTTLRLLTEFKSNNKSLYLVYNTSMKEDAKKKFGQHVEITTVHSLAYRYMKYKMKLDSDIASSINFYDLKNKIDLEYEKLKLAIMFFNYYLQSDLVDIDEDLYKRACQDKKILDYVLYYCANNVLRHIYLSRQDIDIVDSYIMNSNLDILEVIKDIYNLMDQGEIPITHDFYLKKFQIRLLNQDIKFRSNYGLVLLDEAQDSNMVTYSIFRNLFPESTHVAVGDPYQNIYGFRGAINILDTLHKVDKYDKKYLSNSYRFDQSIADMVNNMVKKYLDETIHLKGTRKNNDIPKKIAVISRTNSNIISSISTYNKFYITRNIDDIFSLPKDLYALYDNKKDQISTKNSYLKSINSFEELEEIANRSKDVEMLSAIKIVKTYKGGIHKLYDEAKSKNDQDAEVVLTTAHSSKGLEFSKVIIKNDFPNLQEMKENQDPYLRDEVNLYYVAGTRCKYEITDLTCNGDFIG